MATCGLGIQNEFTLFWVLKPPSDALAVFSNPVHCVGLTTTTTLPHLLHKRNLLLLEVYHE